MRANNQAADRNVKDGGAGEAGGVEAFQKLLVKLINASFPENEGYVLLLNQRLKVRTGKASHQILALSTGDGDWTKEVLGAITDEMRRGRRETTQ